MHVFTWIVTLAGVFGAGVMLLIGMVKDVKYGSPARNSLTSVLEAGKVSVEKAADDLKKASAPGEDPVKNESSLRFQSASIDAIGSTVKALAEFAAAMKDVDPGTRAYLMSLAFLVVALMSASVDRIAMAAPTWYAPTPPVESCHEGARTAVSASRVGARTYAVVPGDTLWQISCEFYGRGGMYTVIARANGLANPDLILPKQLLLIPNQ